MLTSLSCYWVDFENTIGVYVHPLLSEKFSRNPNDYFNKRSNTNGQREVKQLRSHNHTSNLIFEFFFRFEFGGIYLIFNFLVFFKIKLTKKVFSKQESPPAWTQEAYRLRHMKYYPRWGTPWPGLRGRGYLRWGIPPAEGTLQPGLMGGTRGGVPPSQVWLGGIRGGVPPGRGTPHQGTLQLGYPQLDLAGVPPLPGPGRGTPLGVDRQTRTTYAVGKNGILSILYNSIRNSIVSVTCETGSPACYLPFTCLSSHSSLITCRFDTSSIHRSL